MAISEDGFYRLTEDEYSELLEKLKFLAEENKALREQNLEKEKDREEDRMAELDQFREAVISWWSNINQTMKMYEAALGNEHRLRHDRQKLLREIEELRKQVGITAVYDGPKEEDEQRKKTKAGS